MNGQIKELTDTEIRLAFASLCVECAARRMGCTPREMYRRMKRVGLVQAIARKLDPLHTQSREYVTQDIVNAVIRLEAQQGIRPEQKGGTPC